MKFKAIILNAIGESTGITPSGKDAPFLFSRKKIFFTNSQKNDKYALRINRTEGGLEGFFQNDTSYILEIVDDSEGKRRFKMVLPNGGCASYLQLDWLNRIKCNWVHKRYLFQRDPDWFWKTVIAAVIGFIFSLIGIVVGYRLRVQSEPKVLPTTIQPSALPTPK